LKKTIAWILAALLAVMLFPAAASAKQLTYKGFIYNTDFGTLAGYNDLLPNIVNIPKSIEHTDIVRIQGYAFSNAPMETVSVPDTIHQIGSFAFERCYNLKSFTSACKLERITEGLFQYCSSLKTVVLQDGPAIISQNAFRGCTSLEDITIPGSVQTVSNAAFGECTALKSIKMPENLKRICPCAFFRCTSLKEITLPEKTEKIEREAFGECRSLQKVTILCRYTNIEPSAFWDTKAVFYGLIGSEWQSTVENNGNTFRPLCKVTMYPSTDYTVTTAIYPEAGTAIAKPADPEKTGYTFGGWCTDYGCTQGNLWDFSTPVTEDMTLYSKWNLKSYRVNFEGSGQNGPANADYGTKLTKPRDPFRDGFVFAGWYKDSGFKHKWDFSKDTVKGDTTLYAKFTPFKSFKPALTAASADYQDIRGVYGQQAGNRQGVLLQDQGVPYGCGQNRIRRLFRAGPGNAGAGGRAGIYGEEAFRHERQVQVGSGQRRHVL